MAITGAVPSWKKGWGGRGRRGADEGREGRFSKLCAFPDKAALMSPGRGKACDFFHVVQRVAESKNQNLDSRLFSKVCKLDMTCIGHRGQTAE